MFGKKVNSFTSTYSFLFKSTQLKFTEQALTSQGLPHFHDYKIVSIPEYYHFIDQHVLYVVPRKKHTLYVVFR